MLCLAVFANFLFRFFYLSIPGIVLCVVGIWVNPCLWIGLAFLGLDIILTTIDQLRIRKTVMTHSDSPKFNEFMDAFNASDELEIARRIEDKAEEPESLMKAHKKEE